VDLSRVLWIGGPDDGPRAAVAAAVAERLGVPVRAGGGDFRALLAELRALDADRVLVEGDIEAKSVAAVLYRSEQALFIGDGDLDVPILRLDALSPSLPLEELVDEAAHRLSR
jgi:hypothetical protein